MGGWVITFGLGDKSPHLLLGRRRARRRISAPERVRSPALTKNEFPARNDR